MSQSNNAGALAGIKVIDLSRLLGGQIGRAHV